MSIVGPLGAGAAASAASDVSVVIQHDFIADSSANPSTGNQATVLQDGANTYSYIAQDGGNNVANVKLSGEGVNTSGRHTDSAGYVINEPAESVVLQIGTGNAAYVDQISNHAESNVYQGTTFDGTAVNLADGSANNVANVKQNAGGDDSRSDIYQGGVGNIANTTQSSLGGLADVRQNGIGNASDIDQQSGSGHVATVEQYANGNDSSIIQNGTSNTATVGQYSDGNISSVMQSGSGNTATVTQGTH